MEVSWEAGWGWGHPVWVPCWEDWRHRPRPTPVLPYKISRHIQPMVCSCGPHPPTTLCQDRNSDRTSPGSLVLSPLCREPGSPPVGLWRAPVESCVYFCSSLLFHPHSRWPRGTVIISGVNQWGAVKSMYLFQRTTISVNPCPKSTMVEEPPRTGQNSQ